MRVRALPLLLLLLACAGIPANRYGLSVVPDRATYEGLTRATPEKRLTDLGALGVTLDVRYATANNFMKKPLYSVAKAWLRAPAARALQEVRRELAGKGLDIKVFDAYRPYRVTEMMWEPIRIPTTSQTPRRDHATIVVRRWI